MLYLVQSREQFLQTFSDGNFVTAQSANIWASCFKKVLNAVVEHEKSPIPGDLF